jgi:hypothetical protein
MGFNLSALPPPASMQLEFHESYLVGVALVLLLLCNLHGVLLCAKELVYACRELSCCFCCTEACLGPQLHAWWELQLRNSGRKALVGFCFLQPLFVGLVTVVNQHAQIERNTASTLVFCAADVNRSAVRYRDSTLAPFVHPASNTSLSIENDSPHLVANWACAEIDYVLVCLPHAFAVSVTTLTWLRLVKDGVLYEDQVWNDNLYSEGEGRVFLYDAAYFVELLCMNASFALLAADVTAAWPAYFFVTALSCVLVFFVHMARYRFDTPVESLVGVVGVVLLAMVALPFWLSLAQTRDPVALTAVLLHGGALFVVVVGHSISGGEATTAYVLVLRLTVTCSVCAANLLLLGMGVNVLRG